MPLPPTASSFFSAQMHPGADIEISEKTQSPEPATRELYAAIFFLFQTFSIYLKHY